MPVCSLCNATHVYRFHQDKQRDYFQCAVCALIFADPASHLPPPEEKARYQQHQNHPDDPDYRNFLSRLANPLCKRLEKKPLSGLDFGCGPGPTLSVMLEEQGYAMSLYDPHFAPDTSVLARTYDFVTCTEAIEHFYYPAKDWSLLLNCVKPGGWLAIMTQLAGDAAAFATWHYKNDPTHVSFFRRATFHFLADRDRLDIVFFNSDIILLRKAL